MIAIGAALFVGIAIRVSNVFQYPLDMGFDAQGNWSYVSGLLGSWALPKPDSGWSTAHPPLFYYMAGAIGRIFGGLGEFEKASAIHAIRFVSMGFGLLGIATAVVLVRRTDPENTPRAVFAGGLLLFLPVHLYMSAMLTEEILVTTLISIVVVGVGLDLVAEPERTPKAWRRAGFFGAVAGLALLTKLTGLLVIAVGGAAYLVVDLRAARSTRAWAASIVRPGAFGLAALLAAGWFFAWNWFQYGYLYPHALEVHSVMFRMPPGSRGFVDYLSFPWQLFIDPNLLSPNLIHSVWGSTYATIWFDAHRHFVPRDGVAIARLATSILVLGLLPTIAFGIGMVRGIRRVFRSLQGPDVLLLLLVIATFGGYLFFSWRNPWFVVLKGSFLLGLCVPFSFYASEVLADWTRDSGWRSKSVLTSMGLLAIVVSLTFSYGVVLEKNELPGIPWIPVETPWQP
jgi:hypothetical protein